MVNLKFTVSGDWHVAYTLLYGPKRCAIWEETKEEKKEDTKEEVPEMEKME